MSEPGLNTQAQAAAGDNLWNKAPGWRNLTTAASLLTLAAIAVPVLLPQQPEALAQHATKMAATPARPFVPPVRVATAQPQAALATPQPAHPAAVPSPANASPAAASDLPAGGLVVPSGVLTLVNRHNRHGPGQDWPISITIVSPPAHGKVITTHGMALLKVAPGVERNSEVTQVFYQSDSGYSGADRFAYRRTSADPSDPLNTRIYTMALDVQEAGAPPQGAPPPGAAIHNAPSSQSASLAPPQTAPAAAEPAAACALSLSTQAQPMGTGVVVGFEGPLQAQRRVRANQQAIGGPISPAYAMTMRLIVRKDGAGAGAPNQIVVVPPGMAAQLGDRVAFNGIHRDPAAACSYVPPLLTSDAGPAAKAADAIPTVQPRP